jgi:hypothetical protein
VWLSSSLERANFISNKGGKKDGYQQQKTHSHGAMRQHQINDLAEKKATRKGSEEI